MDVRFFFLVFQFQKTWVILFPYVLCSSFTWTAEYIKASSYIIWNIRVSPLTQTLAPSFVFCSSEAAQPDDLLRFKNSLQPSSHLRETCPASIHILKMGCKESGPCGCTPTTRKLYLRLHLTRVQPWPMRRGAAWLEPKASEGGGRFGISRPHNQHNPAHTLPGSRLADNPWECSP